MPQLRHAWVQIHLSTAIVMMFVTGGLLWLAKPSAPKKHYDLYYNLHDTGTAESLDGLQTYVHQSSWGWPYNCFFSGEIRVNEGPADLFEMNKFDLRSFLYDALIVFAILVSVTLFSEQFIRRREARVP